MIETLTLAIQCGVHWYTYHERAVRVFKRCVSRQDGVVRLHYGVGHCRGRVDTELQLGFFAIVRGEAFLDKSTETRTGATTKRVENEEALETSAIICEPTKLVHDNIDLFLANSIMASGICGKRSDEDETTHKCGMHTIAGGVFLASD
jgi:hypothetical protein